MAESIAFLFPKKGKLFMIWEVTAGKGVLKFAELLQESQPKSSLI
jgi:hypothetical protein